MSIFRHVIGFNFRICEDIVPLMGDTSLRKGIKIEKQKIFVSFFGKIKCGKWKTEKSIYATLSTMKNTYEACRNICSDTMWKLKSEGYLVELVGDVDEKFKKEFHIA